MKKTTKKKPIFYNVAIAIVTVIFVLGLVYLVWAMHSSWEIRQFKNSVWVMTHESKARFGEHDGQKVILSEDNAIGLGTFPERQKYRLVIEEPNTLDTVIFTFFVHKEKWTLTVDKMDNDTCRMTLQADRQFQYYFDDNGEFEKYIQLASKEGYITENEPIGGAN